MSIFFKKKKFWSLRSAEVTTNALISTFSVIIILVLVNFLGIKYSWKFDFTENKLYTLSPQTQEVIKNLQEPLQIYVFDSQPNNFDRQLLNNYARYNDLFSFQFVDPQVNLNLTQKFQVDRIGDVYLEWRDRVQLVQTVSPESRLTEEKLTKAMVKIQKQTQAVVYIIQGHGEANIENQGQSSFSQAVRNLQDMGYIVNPLNLGESPLIPPDADVLIVSSSDRELLSGEIKTIKQYLERGGNLMVMYNALSPISLASILEEWGITFNDTLVVDSSGTGEILGLGPSITIITDYGQHPITQDFNNGLTIFPWARPIITENKDNIETIPLLITNTQSWGESNLEGETVEFDPTKDIQGPLNIGVALSKKNDVIADNPNNITENSTPPQESGLNPEEELPKIEGETDLPIPPTMKTPSPITNNNDANRTNKMSREMRLLVIGNSNFATDGWISQQLNSDFFVNSVAWLANEDENNLSIRPKESVNRRLNLTPLQANLISWLAIFIIPALGFIAAIAQRQLRQ
ncbi:GldG family protein [Cyanobacterium aponinum]|uniref:ABC-type uncharacterized transport system n=1 Tax=Cyanobacterium aponinum (strain PCC 10605) TaxID=755178 RepID=K9Z4U4_CYAAP|nr:Gldg family protein [Cyanobacterium aponinum]AFZ54181.1 ABC-type uncharacterized transport system [Cyanobacterium aponinum PCC 10605]